MNDNDFTLLLAAVDTGSPAKEHSNLCNGSYMVVVAKLCVYVCVSVIRFKGKEESSVSNDKLNGKRAAAVMIYHLCVVAVFSTFNIQCLNRGIIIRWAFP